MWPIAAMFTTLQWIGLLTGRQSFTALSSCECPRELDSSQLPELTFVVVPTAVSVVEQEQRHSQILPTG